MYKLIPKEIIKEVPNVQTIILPNDWFDNLSDKQSIYESLYDWMKKKYGISEYDGSYRIHDRTYVGEKLSQKLYIAEKKRLQRKLKIKDDKLECAANWSYLGLSPKVVIENCTISGSVILVIPSSSQQAFEEFSFKIHERKRKAEIAKIKANASGTTFYYWLLPQIGRDDRVGDIAQDAARDEKFPRESNQYEEIKLHLESRGACLEAIESLEESWLEYIRQYPERMQPLSIPIIGKRGCIYFIKSENTNAIKIGFTADRVEKRLSTLQTGHPYKLKLLATIPGTMEYEKSLHKRFANFKLEGEWFQLHPDLQTFITDISKS